MAESLEQLKAALGGLPSDQRAELARFLIVSLEDRFDPDAEAAWDAELARRAEEIRNGTAVGIPAEKVFAELRERFS